MASKAPGLIIAILCMAALPSQTLHARQSIELSGAIRPVFTHLETRQRDGSHSSQTAMNARLHLQANYPVRPELVLTGRLAGRYATTQGGMSFPIRGYTGGSGTYTAGETTIDIFQASWQATDNLRIIGGRFQGRFPLAGFIPKGLDRYYAANLSISHTDGVWVRWNASSLLRIDAILHRNDERGSSHAARTPMRFTDPDSRIGGYLNLSLRDTGGIWVQREVGISVYPSSFERFGASEPLTLTVITARMMRRTSFQPTTGAFWVGGELGFIPDAPTPSSAGFPTNDALSATRSIAWQVSAYANDLFQRHTIGVLYGQTEPNWVISSSFRPNETMSEIRYRYTVSSNLNFEMRYRLRTDKYRLRRADTTQRDNDFYARFTYRF